MASSIQQPPHHEDENSSSSNSHVSFSSPNNANIADRLNQTDALKNFLATATNDWEPNRQVHIFELPIGESISCVLWNNLFHMTGTDIVRCLLCRFNLFGRPVTNIKKFEEGIFSDLRNLKPGTDASLEEPKSEFLEMLYKNNCIRTQKKQKVFFWFSVPHERLFLDALERDLKREKLGLEPTSFAIAEPATSTSLDATDNTIEQIRKSMSLHAVAMEDDSNPSSPTTIATIHNSSSISTTPLTTAPTAADFIARERGHRSTRSLSSILLLPPPPPPPCSPSIITAGYYDLPLATYQQTSYSCSTSPRLLPSVIDDVDPEQRIKIFGRLSLFEGSPSYKQRKRRRTFSALTPFFSDGSLDLASLNAGYAVKPGNLFQVLLEKQEQQQQTKKMHICTAPHCGSVFKRREHLKRHFRTHTLERPYPCKVCGKHFSRTDNLAHHIKTHEKHLSSLGRSNSAGDGREENLIRNQQPVATSSTTSSIVGKLSILTTNDTGSPLFSIDHCYNNDDFMDETNATDQNLYPQLQNQQGDHDDVYMPTAEYNPMWQNTSTSTASSFQNQPHQHFPCYSSLYDQSLSSSPTNPYEQQQQINHYYT